LPLLSRHKLEFDGLPTSRLRWFTINRGIASV
jgi:hypothetical protein